MIDENHPRLSLVRQCALVQISRSSWYYRPVGESQANVRLMRLMDELHLSSTAPHAAPCGYSRAENPIHAPSSPPRSRPFSWKRLR